MGHRRLWKLLLLADLTFFYSTVRVIFIVVFCYISHKLNIVPGIWVFFPPPQKILQVGLVHPWMEERAGGHHRETAHDHLWNVMIISPRAWRKANFIQTLGRGSKGDAGEYQPDSLASIPGNVMSLSVWRPSLSTFLFLFGSTALPHFSTTESSGAKLSEVFCRVFGLKRCAVNPVAMI